MTGPGDAVGREGRPAPSSKSAQRRRSAKSKLEGNDLLYHFFQKTLLESDEEQFRLVTTRLVASLAVWLPPEAYQRYPLLVPYAVRDPTCRGNTRRGIPDAWGSPDKAAQFRDDNSLVKGIPRSLPVHSGLTPFVNGRRLGTSFVASHVWRKLIPSGDAPRVRVTYSFLPNLVWLPSQVSKLSDREDGFVQTLLQAMSLRIYWGVPLTPKLRQFVEPIWQTLPKRPEADQIAIPDPRDLNYFAFDEAWLARRIKTLNTVVAALNQASNGTAVTGKSSPLAMVKVFVLWIAEPPPHSVTSFAATQTPSRRRIPIPG